MSVVYFTQTLHYFNLINNPRLGWSGLLNYF
jgi:hypothetical protein